LIKNFYDIRRLNKDNPAAGIGTSLAKYKDGNNQLSDEKTTLRHEKSNNKNELHCFNTNGAEMSEQQRVIGLVKEAKLYKEQGLLAESKDRYVEILKHLGKNVSSPQKYRLQKMIKDEIEATDNVLKKLEDSARSQKISKGMNTLIKRLFSFSQNKTTAAMEGAVALAKFGQYEQARLEFENLLSKKIHPLHCAKNILRCYLALSDADGASGQMKKWMLSSFLSPQEKGHLQNFLKNAFEKKGLEGTLPDWPGKTCQPQGADDEDEFILEISAFSIHFDSGPKKALAKDFDVTFQVGNTISCVIPKHQKKFIDRLTMGMKLPDIQFYSPLAEFKGSAVVSGKTEIKVGPKAGDYVLDITLDL
jgi:hypothetical protein